MRVSFEVERPISKKNRMHHRGRQVYKDRAVKAFEERVKLLSLQAARQVGLEGPSESFAFQVTIAYAPAIDRALVTVSSSDRKVRKRRRKDIQNLPDTILDAMQGVFYRDDSQVESLLINLV